VSIASNIIQVHVHVLQTLSLQTGGSPRLPLLTCRGTLYDRCFFFLFCSDRGPTVSQTYQGINRAQLTQVLQVLVRIIQVDGPALHSVVPGALGQLPQVAASYQLLKVHDAPLMLALYEGYSEEVIRLLNLCKLATRAMELNNLQSSVSWLSMALYLCLETWAGMSLD